MNYFIFPKYIKSKHGMCMIFERYISETKAVYYKKNGNWNNVITILNSKLYAFDDPRKMSWFLRSHGREAAEQHGKYSIEMFRATEEDLIKEYEIRRSYKQS